MKKYLIIFINQVFVQLSYKFNFLTQVFNQVLGVIVAVFTWNAIYSSGSSELIGQFSKQQMLFYIIIANISMLLFSTNEVVRLGQYVKNGKLTMHLLRPYSFLGQSLAEYLGSKIIYLFMYLLFLFVAMATGTSLLYAGYLLLFLVCNVVMFFLLISWVGTLGFWFIQMWPLRPIMNVVYLVCGGLLFPLHLLPEWAFHTIATTPFALVGYHYTLALQGAYSIREIQFYIVVSLVWIGLLYGLYQLSFRKGLNKYEGMGA